MPFNFTNKRTRLALIHLSSSLALVLPIMGVVIFFWYPSPLFSAMGVAPILTVVIAIHILIFPALTFLVYKQNKPKLILDISIILTLQLLALVYGTTVLSQGRPAWIVFVVDDFELVSPASIYRGQDTSTETYGFSLSRPEFIVASYSEDPALRQQQKEDEMFSGISLATRPETYQPATQHYQAMQARSKPLSWLKQFNPDAKVESVLNKWPQASGWMPLKAPEKDMVVLLNEKGVPLGVVNLNPWQ